MPQPPWRRLAAFAIVSGTLLLLPACSRDEEVKVPLAPSIQGKVTYQGKPVPFGYVLFFAPGKGIDEKTGKIAACGHGAIENGRYEAHDLPVGVLMMSLATDTDADLLAMIGLGRKGGPGKGKAGPGKGDPKAGPGGDPKPGAGGGDPKALHGSLKGMPALPGRTGNPELVATLTDEQKKTLKEIHQKYSDHHKAHLSVPIKEGDQTFDIELK